MKKLHITVPVTGYGDTPDEVRENVLAEGAKVFTQCDPRDLEIVGGKLHLQAIGMGTPDFRRELAAGKMFWAEARVARKPRTRVTEVTVVELSSGSPLIDTLTMVKGYLEAMTGHKPEASELETTDDSDTVTLSAPTPMGKLLVTVRHEWTEDSEKEKEASHG